MGGGEFDVSARLDRMPPIASPIVRSALGTLSVREFRDEFAIPTPVDNEGLVDYRKLIEQVSDFVEPGYKWKAPFFDEHHLYWQSSYYDSAFNVDSTLAQQFRNLPVNKLWVPREFHDFVHLMTIPSDVPEHFTMKTRVLDYKRRNYLYTIASQIVALREVSERVEEHTRLDKNGKVSVYYVDPLTRRSLSHPELLEMRRKQFISQIERHERRGLIDLSSLTTLSLEETRDVEAAIPEIRESLLPSLAKAAGRAAVRVDVPFERIAA